MYLWEIHFIPIPVPSLPTPSIKLFHHLPARSMNPLKSLAKRYDFQLNLYFTLKPYIDAPSALSTPDKKGEGRDGKRTKQDKPSPKQVVQEVQYNPAAYTFRVDR